MNLYDRMTDLAACLCVEIEDAGLPEPCFCGVVPGDRVVAAYVTDCERDGIAWVRLATMYPSQTVGQQSATVGNCAGGLGVDLEVGIMRAFPIPEDPNDDFDLAILANMVERETKDAMVLYRAVYCCPSIPSKEVIVGSFNPVPILGGTYGGSITVHMAL